jgi:heme-degrading monooxygenase HmoA
MHAVFSRVTINDDPEAALKRLREEVVPRVSGLPGLVAGYWMRPEANQGRSLIVFESEEAARAAAENMRGNMPDPVTLDSIDVLEVVAHT